jgi:hypothetical protein
MKNCSERWKDGGFSPTIPSSLRSCEKIGCRTKNLTRRRRDARSRKGNKRVVLCVPLRLGIFARSLAFFHNFSLGSGPPESGGHAAHNLPRASARWPCRPAGPSISLRGHLADQPLVRRRGRNPPTVRAGFGPHGIVRRASSGRQRFHALNGGRPRGRWWESPLLFWV